MSIQSKGEGKQSDRLVKGAMITTGERDGE